jgi:hypothetical protein
VTRCLCLLKWKYQRLQHTTQGESAAWRLRIVPARLQTQMQMSTPATGIVPCPCLCLFLCVVVQQPSAPAIVVYTWRQSAVRFDFGAVSGPHLLLLALAHTAHSELPSVITEIRMPYCNYGIYATLLSQCTLHCNLQLPLPPVITHCGLLVTFTCTCIACIVHCNYNYYICELRTTCTNPTLTHAHWACAALSSHIRLTVRVGVGVLVLFVASSLILIAVAVAVAVALWSL